MTDNEIRRNIKKRATNHICPYENQIVDMHKIIVGNGDPEHSMVAQMILINERQREILKTINDIEDRRKRLFPMLLKIIGTASALIMVYLGYRNLIYRQQEIQQETRITNDILDSNVRRGNIYDPFAVDTEKKARFFDTLTFK